MIRYIGTRSYEVAISGWVVSGNYNISSDPEMINISGIVNRDGVTMVLSFNAICENDSRKYSFSDIINLEWFLEAAPIISGTVDEVINEIKNNR